MPVRFKSFDKIYDTTYLCHYTILFLTQNESDARRVLLMAHLLIDCVEIEVHLTSMLRFEASDLKIDDKSKM